MIKGGDQCIAAIDRAGTRQTASEHNGAHTGHSSMCGRRDVWAV